MPPSLALASPLPSVRRMSDPPRDAAPGPSAGQAPDPAPDPAPDRSGALLRERVVAALGDRFEVGVELGRGGMAVVYRAREVRLRREIALKVLPPDLAFRTGVRERFLREAQTAAQLSHPHIVPVYAADETQGVAWLAMALVDGETLGARMARQPRGDVAEARRILAQVADALAYAHARGVVHRDVKPDNVLLERATGRALVTDFGIARAAEEEELRLTLTGVSVGTPAYMSPEQALGEVAIDGRADLYALGVVAYQLLAGELPFHATSATGMLMKHVGEPLPPLRGRRADVPPGLAHAIERALAKKPADRWPDAERFRLALLQPDDADERLPIDHPAGARSPDAEGPGAPTAAAPRAPLDPGLDVAVGPALGPAPGPAPAPGRSGRPTPVGLGDPVAPDARAPSESWRDAREAAREELREQRREWQQRRRDLRDPYGDPWRDVAPLPDDPRVADPRAADPRPAQSPSYARGDVPGLGPLGGLPGALPVPVGVPAADSRADALPAPPGGSGQAERLEREVEQFRGHAFAMLALVAFLAWINAAHAFFPPWVIFPALGISRGVRQRWRPLRAAGLDFWEVMLDGPARAVARARPDAPAAGGMVRGDGGRRLRELQREARRFRLRVARSAMLLLLFLGGLLGVAATPQGGFSLAVVIGLVGGLFSALGAVRGAARLREAGVAPRAVLSPQWREVVAAAVPRPRDEVLAEELARLASDDVLAGPWGPALRGAVDDRLTVRETMARLADVDRALIPDVRPTVDALVERIAGLAQSLHRIDGDSHPGSLADLDARLERAREAAANAPAAGEQARTLQLLERQRASLGDLLERRERLARQLESAQLALQNVKLDLLKLRSSGVGALGEVNTATQEARALSRDIQHALEAAAEVRRG